MSAAPQATAVSEVDVFIARWQHASGSELANAQLFLSQLTALLVLPEPDPAREDTRENAYVFERRVRFKHGDGSESEGRIDCYKRGAFVLEAKKLRQAAATKGFDDAMLRARAQAENYARALPADEGRPPFLLVVDVGHAIEFYAEFTRSGATYTPFPDPRSHRIRLADLREHYRSRPDALGRIPDDLWCAMDRGDSAASIAAQEAQGEVHWLRPDYQCAAQAMPAAEQGGLDLSGLAGLQAPIHGASRAEKIAWPADLPAQVAAVAGVLAHCAVAQSLAELAAHFTGRGGWKTRLPQIVDTLVALGRAREAGGGKFLGTPA